jgi:hypothetical protein
VERWLRADDVASRPDTRLLSDAQLEDAKKTGAGKTA